MKNDKLLELFGYPIEYLMKKWNKSREIILKLQKDEAKNILCEIECDAYQLHLYSNTKIITSVKQLNNILNGGIPKLTITEIVGPPGSGKSQFCMSLSAENILKNDSIKIIYIDTNKNFSLNRFISLLGFNQKYKNGLPPKINDILSRLFLIEPENFDDFKNILNNLETLIRELSPLIIILDCPAFYIRGIEDTTIRLSMSTTLVATLKQLAVRYKLVVILTNQITGMSSNPTNCFESGNINSALGNSWCHHINFRFYFSLNPSSEIKDTEPFNNIEESFCRKIHVIKSPSVHNLSIPFKITGSSLIDSSH